MVGYIFCFGLTIDNVTVFNQYYPFSNNNIGRIDNGFHAIDGTDRYFKAKVAVTSEGVISFNIESEYTYIKDTDDVNLLTFEQADDAARNILKDKYSESSSSTNNEFQYDINGIQFGYAVVKEDEEKMLIPVWCYTSYTGTGSQYPIIIINAISGEEVTDAELYYWDE